MGEKTGGLTNAIITIVALVAIVLIVNQAFPELGDMITNAMKSVINDSISLVGAIMPTMKFLP